MFDSSALARAGVLLILAGFFLVFAGSFLSSFSSQNSSSHSEFAVGGFIGFIPFGFATDKRLLAVVLALSFFFFLFWVWLILR